MKTASIADLHHCPDWHLKVMRILDQVKEVAPEVDLITNSGENFHMPYQVQKVFNELLDKWEEITDIRPVATINATQGKHEREGMVETLTRAGIDILRPGQGYFYANGKIVNSTNRDIYPELLLFGVPHPHKAHLMSKPEYKDLSNDELNSLVNKSMRGQYDRYGAMRAEYPNIRALAIGHGVVQGEETRGLHAIKNSSIYSTEADLARMGCDFYAWGHYHIPTKFKSILGQYLGSMAYSYGELDYKPAITIIDWDTMEVKRHDLDINIKKKIFMFPEGEVPEESRGSGCFSKIPDLTGTDCWLVNNHTEFTAEDVKEAGAGQIKVTTEIEKELKIRSKEVMEAETYQDKMKSVYPDVSDRHLKESENFWIKDIAAGIIPEKKVITPLWMEVHGSKTFLEGMDKETVRIDYTSLDAGLTMLIGPGGHGKSSLFDYSSFRSILFLQPNSLISTFELSDSYIKGEIQVNDDIYRIELKIKPNLASPKIEYYAFKNNEKIDGISGIRKPFDEWQVKLFGTPRKYSTSVLNTQFDDNDSTFDKQPVNPSLCKATNVQLKDLFHELAGTNLKHIELKCKQNADEFNSKIDLDVKKRSGVAEKIPCKAIVGIDILGLNKLIKTEELMISSKQVGIGGLQKQVLNIEDQGKANTALKTVISTIKQQLMSESSTKAGLDRDLLELGSLDVDSINRQILDMDAEKIKYDAKLKELPVIQNRNTTARNNHSTAIKNWNDSEKQKRENYATVLQLWNDAEKTRKDNYTVIVQNWNNAMSDIRTFNSGITTINAEISTAKNNKSRSETRKLEKIALAVRDTFRTNEDNFTNYNNKVTTLEKDISNLNTSITTGAEFIKNLRECPECGFMDNEVKATKVKYEKAIVEYEKQHDSKEIEKESLIKPDEVTITADFTQEDKEILDADVIINQEVEEFKKETFKPVEPTGDIRPVEPLEANKPEDPTLEDETIPTFDNDKYEELKEKVSSYSEDKVTEIRGKISTSLKQIESLNAQIRQEEAKILTIDYSVKELITSIESKIKEISEKIQDLKTDVAIKESKIVDINKMQEALVEYDERIAADTVEYEFWNDMRVKWGANGIPARILEHTGPYVDELANNILKEYYPDFRLHSETIKKDSTGKKDLEVFNIMVINQRTGRDKPLNCISGEERNFTLSALRAAFREVNKQNSLEEWTVLFEDEPDAHVSESQLQMYWDMVEATTPGKKVIAISHSPEIKHRSTTVIDIRSL